MIFVGLHQIDHKSALHRQNFPYMSIAIALVKKFQNKDFSVGYKIINFDEFECQRDLQAQFLIEEPGTYIVVPVTTGCSLVSPYASSNDKSNASSQKTAQITNKNGKLTDLAKLTLSQVFLRLDSAQIDNRLETGELLSFFEKFESNMGIQNQKRLTKRIKSIKTMSCDQFLMFV